MPNSSRGLFNRLFNKKNGAEVETSAIPADPAQVEPAPEDMTGKEPALSSGGKPAGIPDADSTPLEKAPLFPESGHIWKEYMDPLYVRPQESDMIQECYYFVRRMEKDLEKRNAIRQAEGEKANQTPPVQNENDDGSESETQTPPEPETIPTDVDLHLHLSPDSMAAWIYALPPYGGGQEISMELLQAALKQNRVSFGLLDDNINRLVDEKVYGQPILAARGIPAKDGIDGSVKDYYKREVTHEFVMDSKGNIDFKQLNNVQQIQAGEVICDIAQPVPGIPGKTVTGNTVPCRVPGKAAAVPMGAGTALSEDHCQLIARLNGHLLFKGSAFLIDPILKIPGDVDGSTGNLDYNGDISIGGDVRNGFSVKARGSILIRGSVEGAVLEAGNDICISSGVTGSGRASLTAGGSIKCKYLEHCTATALGDIQAESMVLCQVQSNRNVIVTYGIGAIIGGQIVAASSIQAKSIGSRSRNVTTLVLGTPFKAVEERKKAEQDLKQNQHNLSELDKNIHYLESGGNSSKAHLLGQLKEARQITAARKNEVEALLAELDRNVCDLQSSRIQCSRLYPVTNLQIGQALLRVDEEYSNCNIYYSKEGEIVIGAR